MLSAVKKLDRRSVAMRVLKREPNGREFDIEAHRECCVGGIKPCLHLSRRTTRCRVFIVRIVRGPRPSRKQHSHSLNAVCFSFEQTAVVSEILRRRQRLCALALKNEKIGMLLSKHGNSLCVSPMVVEQRATGGDRANLDFGMQR